MSEVWDLLKRQSILTSTTLDFNLDISHAAWSIAAPDIGEKEIPKQRSFWKSGSLSSPKNSFEKEEIDSTSILSDNALKTWVMAYLLY